jgi:hypothetical protein
VIKISTRISEIENEEVIFSGVPCVCGGWSIYTLTMLSPERYFQYKSMAYRVVALRVRLNPSQV